MQQALLPRVQTAFQRAFDLDPRSITLDTQPSDIPRWDSFGRATLALSLEFEFNIMFDDDELMALENVREIIRVVLGKLRAPSDSGLSGVSTDSIAVGNSR
jgi:acyl carrier protein